MMTFTITPDGAPSFVVIAASRDILLWERIGRHNTLKRLDENPTIGDFYSLAHVAARRQGLYQGTLEEMSATCDINHKSDNGNVVDRDALVDLMDGLLARDIPADGMADEVLTWLKEPQEVDPTRPAR